MFHFTPRRIEAHVCICFVAYKIYKELERLLKANQVNMSVDKVLDVAKTIATISIQVPLTGETITKPYCWKIGKPSNRPLAILLPTYRYKPKAGR